jgi:hypothetical protein
LGVCTPKPRDVAHVKLRVGTAFNNRRILSHSAKPTTVDRLWLPWGK